jgi:2-polyprenyl-3-methyl-5-hydroxy-6-metoxy-1,4-benzoquinol methylase/uncharacterized protein YndB with AHSA1/START domain
MSERRKNKMERFQLAMSFEVPAEKLYAAIAHNNGPSHWWTEHAQVGEKVGDEASFRFYGGGHSRFRITELDENRRVEWLCVDSDNSEWRGTRVRFEIKQDSEGSSVLQFEHVGLKPVLECYEECATGWTFILRKSLKGYLETGVGELAFMKEYEERLLNDAMTTAEIEPDTPEWDEAKSEAFSDGFIAALNASSLMMMSSIGHRTGLFDTMDGMSWSTLQQIAEAAGLNDRYVREWLGAMVTGGVVEYRPTVQTYRLPAEHARWLTRRVSPDNLSVTAQWISVLGCVETRIVEKFKTGGGLHYECFERFHETMAEESAQTVVAALQDHILPLSEGLADQLQKGIAVVDVGCGSGRAACSLAEAFPASTFTGYDLVEEAIEAATSLGRERGLDNATFLVKDITTLDEPERYDLVTAFDIVHDQKDPVTVLSNIYSLLKPGGTFLMQDIAGSSYLEKNLDHPIGPFGYTVSTMHCMTVSLAQGGAGLGTMWGEELAEKMLADAGFTKLVKHKLPHDFINVYYVMKKE